MPVETVNMDGVMKKYIVMSGKGGVGKSTVAVNLAASLALQGKRVGLLDIDIHGPSVPTMLGLEEYRLESTGEKMIPAELPELGILKIMSIGFMLQASDAPVIWRGPMKTGVIKQFLKDVEWGELDCLIIDCPPGTGDEPLSVIQLIRNADGAILVTTPQDVAAIDVSKSINFCKKLNLPVTGIIENMSGFVCPECSKITYIFKKGGGRRLADEYNVPFLGSLPLDPSIAEAGDSGIPYVMKFKESPVSGIYTQITRSIV